MQLLLSRLLFPFAQGGGNSRVGDRFRAGAPGQVEPCVGVLLHGTVGTPLSSALPPALCLSLPGPRNVHFHLLESLGTQFPLVYVKLELAPVPSSLSPAQSQRVTAILDTPRPGWHPSSSWFAPALAEWWWSGVAFCVCLVCCAPNPMCPGCRMWQDLEAAPLCSSLAGVSLRVSL